MAYNDVSLNFHFLPLMISIWELKCLELQHAIISIIGSSVLKTYTPEILSSRAHIIKNLIHFQDGEGSCLDGA